LDREETVAFGDALMPKASVAIDFRLTDAGWADCDLSVGDKAFTLSGISYTTDALGDLVRLALMIATGAETATAQFDHEPAESRLWVYNLGGQDGFFLKVLLFGSASPNEPNHLGDIVFSTECNATDFSDAVLTAAKRVWEKYGAGGYTWLDYPFPMRALRALETALATDDPTVLPR
jgi:hypothetical protein